MADFTPNHGPSVDQERAHAFDGITEYDNSLPNWWLWVLYLSVAFACWYGYHFHFSTGVLSKADADQYEQHVAAAKAEAKKKAGIKTEDDLRKLSHDPERIAKGKELTSMCMACHGPELTGLIGPNLRDKYWIYGSSMSAIIETLTKGRDGGMPAQVQFSPDEIEAVACYIADLNRQGEQPGMRPQADKEKEDPITY